MAPFARRWRRRSALRLGHRWWWRLWHRRNDFGRLSICEQLRGRGALIVEDRERDPRGDLIGVDLPDRARLLQRRLCGGGGVQERAIGAERCNRQVAADKQAAHPLAERQLGPGGLRGHHEDCMRAVREGDARAVARQRAADAGSEAAQAFEPRAFRRQGVRKPRDLGGGRLAAVEPPLRQRCGRLRAENRRASGIGEDDVLRIRRPKPSRQRAGRKRSKPSLAQPPHPRFSFAHRDSAAPGMPPGIRHLSNF